MEILVLGCGVTGLTTATRLLAAGHQPRIWARELPPQTTSNVAAAVWYPYRAYPEERVAAWGAVAYRTFERLAREAPESGVLMADVLDLKPVPVGEPWWSAGVEGFRHANTAELPDGYEDGYVLVAPVIDTSVYLDYLRRQFEAAGGSIERRTVRDLAEAFAACPVVVNCVGLGARELLGDTDIHPARGQVVRVRHTGFRTVLLDDDGPNALSYIVPRAHDIVLGGIDVDGNPNGGLDPVDRQGILRRCARLVQHYDPVFAAGIRALLERDIAGDPCVANAFPLATDVERTSEEMPVEIVSEAAGLRPVRSAVRLERERVAPDRWVIHNYGHGGAGVTLSWGCAEEVLSLLEAVSVINL